MVTKNKIYMPEKKKTADLAKGLKKGLMAIGTLSIATIIAAIVLDPKTEDKTEEILEGIKPARRKARRVAEEVKEGIEDLKHDIHSSFAIQGE